MASEYRFKTDVTVVRPPRKLSDLRPGPLGYLVPLLKGLTITMRHFFIWKKATIFYPEFKKNLPSTYRGFPRLIFNVDKQIENCVACKLCERVCPPRAISITPGEHTDPNVKERRPAKFVIDYGRCIVCGLCEEACPCDAIGMSKDYERAAYTRADLIMNRDALLIPKDRLRITPTGSKGLVEA